MYPVSAVDGTAIAPGSTAVYEAWLLDYAGNPIPGSALTTLTLTIIDTVTETVVNGVLTVNILNTGRGSADNTGKVTVTLEPNDTALQYPISVFRGRVQRSLIFNYTYNAGAAVGGQRENFWIEGYPTGTYLTPVP